MSPLRVIIVAFAFLVAVKAKPHVPFATPGFASPVLPLPPSFHPTQFLPTTFAFHPAPFLPHPEPLPLFAHPAPVLPAPPIPAPIIPADPVAVPCPVPLPVTRELPPIFDPVPFTPLPSYRAIPGPITKTNHISYGFAYPAHLTKFAGTHAHLHAAPLAFPSHHHSHHGHLFA